jgi:energy-coupling factor transport system permease protein
MNTRTKILIVFTLSFIALLFEIIVLLVGLSVVAFFLYLAGRKKSISREGLMSFKSLFILLISLIVVQILFRSSGAIFWHWGAIKITWDGLHYGTSASLRLIILFLSASFLLNISYRDYLMAFQSWKLPYELSFLMASVLQFLPILRRQFQQMGEALAIRSIELGRLPLAKRIVAYTELIFPILGKSISSLKFRVISLEMRGFRLSNKRTSLHRDYLKAIDYVVQCGLLIIIILVLYLKFKS